VTRPRTRSSSGCRSCSNKTLNPPRHSTEATIKLYPNYEGHHAQNESGSRMTSSTSSRRGTLSTNVSIETNHCDVKVNESHKHKNFEMKVPSKRNNSDQKQLDESHVNQIVESVPLEAKDDKKNSVKRVPTQVIH